MVADAYDAINSADAAVWFSASGHSLRDCLTHVLQLPAAASAASAAADATTLETCAARPLTWTKM